VRGALEDNETMFPRAAVSLWIGVVAIAVSTLAAPHAADAGTSGETQTPNTAGQPAVEQIGPNLYRVGRIRVDVARRELTVGGTINPDVRTLEFIANARDGQRAYETAVTLDTDAFTFNTALLLIGLDRSRTRNAPKSHFDPARPEGDTVDISFECPGRECQRMPAEHLMYDQTTKSVLSKGTWVYTGSMFLPDGRYFAQVDGTLVSFVHDPASIIEYAAGAGLNRYGSIILNPNLGLPAGTNVTMTFRALRPAPAR
jgi:hypothetical protein